MSQPNNTPLVLTAQEAARVLRIGKNTVFELLHAGRLRGIRIGRRWIVPQAAVDAFLGQAELEEGR